MHRAVVAFLIGLLFAGPSPGAVQDDDDPMYAAGFLDRGKRRYSKGDLDGALKDFDAAIRLRPEGSTAYEWRALAWIDKRQPAKAIADCERCLQLDPVNPYAFLYRGKALADEKDYTRAVADYTEAIRLGETLPQLTQHALANRGLAYSHLKDHGKALDDYAEAIRLRPGEARLYSLRARVRSAERRFAEAITDLSEAIRLAPDTAENYVQRGVALAALGKDGEALTDYNEAIRRNPDHDRVHAHRSMSLNRMKKYEEAFADACESIRRNPTLSEPYSTRAWVHLNHRKNTRAALRDANDAVCLDPNDARGRDVLAWILATSSDPDLLDGPKAVEHAHRACELDRWKNGSYIDTLAAAYACCGQLEEAVKWQTKALEDDAFARGPGGADARKRLDRYQGGDPAPPNPTDTRSPKPVVIVVPAPNYAALAFGGGLLVVARIVYMRRRLRRWEATLDAHGAGDDPNAPQS